MIGADRALSAVGKQCVPSTRSTPLVSTYHEIVRVPRDVPDYGGTRCDVVYDGRLSPDFYAWVLPHGDTASIGAGSASSTVVSVRSDTSRMWSPASP